MYSRRGQKERGGVSRSRHSFVSHTWSSPPVFRCSSKSSVCICPNCSSTNLACTYFGELFSLRPRVRSREFLIFMAPSAATQWKKLRQTEGTASWSNFIVVIQLVAERVERKKSACSMSCRSRRMLSARSLLDYFDQVLQGNHHYGTSPRIYALCRAGFEFGFNKKCSSFFSECLFWMPRWKMASSVRLRSTLVVKNLGQHSGRYANYDHFSAAVIYDWRWAVFSSSSVFGVCIENTVAFPSDFEKSVP